MDEDDFQFILKQFNSKFIRYEISPGVYSTKDISEVVHTMKDHKGTLKIECDDITLKTKLILSHFGATYGTLGFDKKSFSNILLGFVPYWDYKTTRAFHVDSPGVYTCENITNLSTKDKVRLECDVIDGSVVNGI